MPVRRLSFLPLLYLAAAVKTAVGVIPVGTYLTYCNMT